MSKQISELFLPLSSLEDITDTIIKKLEKIGIKRIIDLLFYLPTNIIVRHFCKNIHDIKPKQYCIIQAQVLSYQKNKNMTRVICADNLGNTFYISLFKVYKNYLKNYLQLNEKVLILGIATMYNGNYTFNHPDKILPPSLKGKIKPLECVYKQHHEITSYKFSILINKALDILKSCYIPEWLSDEYIKKYKLPTFIEAMCNLHNPIVINNESNYKRNITRVAIDETIAYHIHLLKEREISQQDVLLNYQLTGNLTEIFKKHLPFKLTQDQKKAIKTIKEEFLKNIPSTTLLQGDVGSGKTIVCFIISLFALESNYQVAFMAPTEVLAVQHFNTLKKYAEKMNINIDFLKGKEKQSVKKKILDNLINGKTNIIVGTHSLFQDKVQFKNLGLVIIDEQHRFGVKQRLQLLNKGNHPNLLLTTATPIPRTLALSIYGDILYCDIKEKPNIRQSSITKIMSKEKINDLLLGIKRVIKKGEKVFWVCPLIDVSEKLSLTSSIERYDYLLSKLKKEFNNISNQLFLIHGKMSPEEKNEILSKFKEKKNGAILVATTIIEVGIDIPECNIIIIEEAQQFGLSQLHQLRGRVGRGNEKGICILLYSPNLSVIARNRLETLRTSDDGFYIAEQDMKFRGYGDILGTNQSGDHHFKFLDLSIHNHHMKPSFSHAKFLYYQSKNDNTKYLHAINILLKIFNREEKNGYLQI